MRAVVRFLLGEPEQRGQVGERSLLEFLFVKLQKEREVLARWTGAGKVRAGDALEPKFRHCGRERAREAGRLRYGRKVSKGLVVLRGVNNPIGDRFNAKPANGRKHVLGHAWRRELRRELQKCKCVDSLAATLEGVHREFVRGRAGAPENQDFRISAVGAEETGRLLEQWRIGTATDRAMSHKQLYLSSLIFIFAMA